MVKCTVWGSGACYKARPHLVRCAEQKQITINKFCYASINWTMNQPMAPRTLHNALNIAATEKLNWLNKNVPLSIKSLFLRTALDAHDALCYRNPVVFWAAYNTCCDAIKIFCMLLVMMYLVLISLMHWDWLFLLYLGCLCGILTCLGFHLIKLDTRVISVW